MKWNKFERKYIPNIRHNKVYIVFKYIIIIPIIFLIYTIKMGMQKIKKPIRISRSNKPDIVLSNIIAGWGNLIFTDPQVEA